MQLVIGQDAAQVGFESTTCIRYIHHMLRSWFAYCCLLLLLLLLPGYNYLPTWDYSLVAEGMCNKSGKYKVFKVGDQHSAAAADRCITFSKCNHYGPERCS
jgi:hypothetical protein